MHIDKLIGWGLDEQKERVTERVRESQMRESERVNLGLAMKASMMHIDKFRGWGLGEQKERESSGESERVKWERAREPTHLPNGLSPFYRAMCGCKCSRE